MTKITLSVLSMEMFKGVHIADFVIPIFLGGLMFIMHEILVVTDNKVRTKVLVLLLFFALCLLSLIAYANARLSGQF